MLCRGFFSCGQPAGATLPSDAPSSCGGFFCGGAQALTALASAVVDPGL